MAKEFGPAERHICGLFSPGSSFIYDHAKYTVTASGKPVCSKGEPKTDIYVLASSASVVKEFKISFKKGNADFLENKTNSERAELLFGPNWSEIICNATVSLQNEFENRSLIYKQKCGRADKGAITLGWKFELLRVRSDELSGSMLLNRDQVIDVYAGTNLPDSKKNAMVNGGEIPNSGVANYILFEDETKVPQTIQEAINCSIAVEDYVDMHPGIYFACKALNYRTFRGKYDGNCPLAVYVDWSVDHGRLTSNLVYDTPLAQGGDYAYAKLASALRQLGVKTTDDLNSQNVKDPGIIWG